MADLTGAIQVDGLYFHLSLQAENDRTVSHDQTFPAL